MVSLTFHGGVGEIGGNKILLEDGDARIWFDFGRSFTFGERYFTGWLQPRGSSFLRDVLEFKLLPSLRGFYDPLLLPAGGLSSCEPEYSALFLSHAHGDHIGHLDLIDPRIPVHLGSCTKLFLDAMETSSQRQWGSHPYHTFRTGKKISVDGVEVEPIHVDHSVPGAYGFLIHTSAGTVAYTGDYRLHGPMSGMTREFLEAAQKAEPRLLITEGTRVETKSKRRNVSEHQVEAGIRELAGGDKLLLYTHGPRDIDRIKSFLRCARETGRQLVVSPKAAHLLAKLAEDEKLDAPDPLTDDLIRVWYKPKKSGKYDDKDYYVWERPYLAKRVTLEEIQQSPGRYMVNIDFSSLTELIDIRPAAGSPYVYSMSEHFMEDQIEGEILGNWMSHFQLDYRQIHASGHISRSELKEALEGVGAEEIIPIHTEHPELFEAPGKITEPKLGVPHRI